MNKKTQTWTNFYKVQNSSWISHTSIRRYPNFKLIPWAAIEHRWRHAQIFGLHPEAIAVQTEKFERDLI
jgi:hypothetical protein